MVFISSKKLFPFSRYSNYCTFIFPFFFLLFCHCLRGCLKINLKVDDVISCLNDNLITHFIWYLGKEKRYDIESLSIDRLLHKEKILSKNHAENVHQKLVPDPILILVNNPKEQLYARNSFKNKIFWKRIIKNFLKS